MFTPFLVRSSLVSFKLNDIVGIGRITFYAKFVELSFFPVEFEFVFELTELVVFFVEAVFFTMVELLFVLPELVVVAFFFTTSVVVLLAETVDVVVFLLVVLFASVTFFAMDEVVFFTGSVAVVFLIDVEFFTVEVVFLGVVTFV